MTDIYAPDGTALPEMTVSMLSARNAAARETVMTIHSTAERLCIKTDDAGIPVDPVMRSVYLSLTETCWQLQHSIACTDELLCYENGLQKPEEALDLCRTLRHFVNVTDELTDDCLEIGRCEIPNGLYAQVHPERLTFVLLHMLVSALRDFPDANVMDFTAGCVNQHLRLELVLRRDNEAETPAFRMPEPADEAQRQLPDAPEALTARFCRLYGARLLQQSAEEKSVCTLALPAARVQNPLAKVSSDSAQMQDELLYRAVLSEFVPAEKMLTVMAERM